MVPPIYGQADSWRRAIEQSLLSLAVALGVGLLVGAERERRKMERPTPSAAGVRTFAVAALAGAISYLVGGVAALVAVVAAVGLFTGLAYWRTRDDDPGITTEVALIVAVLLGALAVPYPSLAAGCGTVLAILLAFRGALHRFVGSTLTEDEMRDALIFAGATLVVLPLLPDRGMGPYGALNPHTIFLVVVLVLAIAAVGHIGVRAFGAARGLAVAGLAGGFVSSVATINAMGASARKTPPLLPGATAGAVLSTVATILQMGAVMAAASLPTLRALTVPLLCAGAAAIVYGAVFTLFALRRSDGDPQKPGRAFSLKSALIFAALIAVILLATAAMRAAFGEAGTIAAAAVAGFADVHATSVSIASLVAVGQMDATEAVVPILVAFTTNSVAKIAVAATGGARFAAGVIPGVVAVVAAAWGGAFAAGLIG